MSSYTGFSGLASKTKNVIVAGGSSAFVLRVYHYAMRAVGGTDELQVAIDKSAEIKSVAKRRLELPFQLDLNTSEALCWAC